MATHYRIISFDGLPPAIKGLIITCGVFFLADLIYPDSLIWYLGLMPLNVIHKFWVWQLFTYSFLHGGFWHLLFNMFALWMFGPHIERRWGTRKFLVYYFICVLGAALSQSIVAPNSLVVGASGGVYGLLLAFGLLFPRVVLYLFFMFPLRAIQAVLVIAAITLVSSLGSSGSPIAHFAHLGGMLTGFLYFRISEWLDNSKSWPTTKGQNPPDRNAFLPRNKITWN